VGVFGIAGVEPSGSATGDVAMSNDTRNYDYSNEILPDVGLLVLNDL
jgi:hypothetical protein